MRLLYLANVRLPTEKAHGLQIVQNCEAFAEAGADVTLWTARRVNTAELRGIDDVWTHYGVKRNFELRRLPCLDLIWLVPNRTGRLAQVIFWLQLDDIYAGGADRRAVHARRTCITAAISWCCSRSA